MDGSYSYIYLSVRTQSVHKNHYSARTDTTVPTEHTERTNAGSTSTLTHYFTSYSSLDVLLLTMGFEWPHCVARKRQNVLLLEHNHGPYLAPR